MFKKRADRPQPSDFDSALKEIARLEDELEQSRQREEDLCGQNEKENHTHWVSEWLFPSKKGRAKKETDFSWLICDLPNYDKPLFHDALKGFEEFSRLKGYVVLLSIDTSMDNKIAFKFNLPNSDIKWSTVRVYSDLSDYLQRVMDNRGIEDVVSDHPPLQKLQIQYSLKNRLLFIQHVFDSRKATAQADPSTLDDLNNVKSELYRRIQEALDREVNLQNQISEIETTYQKALRNGQAEAKQLLSDLQVLRGKLTEAERTSLQAKVEYELRLSDLQTRHDMLQNKCQMQEGIIDHLKDMFCKILSNLPNYSPTLQITGGIKMIDQSQHVNAPVNSSNLATHSPGATQNLTLHSELEGILTQMLSKAESDDTIGKNEYLKINEEIQALRTELQKPEPQKLVVERALSNLGSLASLTSLVAQIAPFLPALL